MTRTNALRRDGGTSQDTFDAHVPATRGRHPAIRRQKLGWLRPTIVLGAPLTVRSKMAKVPLSDALSVSILSLFVEASNGTRRTFAIRRPTLCDHRSRLLSGARHHLLFVP